jgi:hypothetical protein
MGYATDQTMIQAFTTTDTFGMAMSAGPLTTSLLSLPGYELVDTAKKAKVTEIIQIAENLYQTSTSLMQKLTTHQETYLTFLNVLLQSPGSSKIAKELLSQRLALAAKERALDMTYQSIVIPSTGDMFAQGTLAYQKVLLANELASTVWYDFRHTVTQTLELNDALSGSTQTVRDAYIIYEKRCADLDAMNDDLMRMQTVMVQLEHGLKQIATADYLISKASIIYMRQQLPAVQEKSASLSTSTELTQENIEFINEYLSQIDDF